MKTQNFFRPILSAVVLTIAAAGIPTLFAHSALAEAGAKKVFFSNIKDGDSVTSPVHVVMKVEGMTVVPAGEAKEGTGHHHLIIDGAPVKAGEVVPKDETHLHFGGGQTETDVPLAAGETSP